MKVFNCALLFFVGSASAFTTTTRTTIHSNNNVFKMANTQIEKEEIIVDDFGRIIQYSEPPSSNPTTTITTPMESSSTVEIQNNNVTPKPPSTEPLSVMSSTTEQTTEKKPSREQEQAPRPSVMATPSVVMAATKSSPKIMSMSMPFMERPIALDGTLAGDVGFDPIGFAKTNKDLLNYREAEIKHARLAMLAAAGWPLSELWDKKLAAAFSLPSMLGDDDRAPSPLNGGLDKISIKYWIACLLLASAVDIFGIFQKSNDNYFPGNLGFDPLGLYPKDEAGKKEMQLKEIKNGRLAMLAVTGFAVQEFTSKLGVVDETPVFFKPIGEVMKNYATNAVNNGYY